MSAKTVVGARIVSDGHEFHSEQAFRTYRGLKKLLAEERIANLKVNETYPILINQIELGKVTITFHFDDLIANRERFVVVTGSGTKPLRTFKIRCFEAQYGKIVEIWV